MHHFDLYISTQFSYTLHHHHHHLAIVFLIFSKGCKIGNSNIRALSPLNYLYFSMESGFEFVFPSTLVQRWIEKTCGIISLVDLKFVGHLEGVNR